MKKAALNQFTSSQPFDDFSKSALLQSIEPIAKLDYEAMPWKETSRKNLALFLKRSEDRIFITSLRFRAVNEYYVNTEAQLSFP